jgi:SAM-dependent methyltransferase
MEPAYYARYSSVQNSHWWYLGRSAIIESTLDRWAGTGPGRRILDLGCGPGGMRPMMSRFGAVFSTDFSPEALRFCAAQKIGHLCCAGAVDLPFQDNVFDIALALDVIEHVQDDVAVLREVRRVLKPDGVALITVPAFQFLWGRQDVVSHHLRRYTAGTLENTARQAGLEIAHGSYFNTVLFPMVAGVRLLARCRNALGATPAPASGSDFDSYNPDWLNAILERAFRMERRFVPHCRLPFGISALIVAKRAR